MKLCDCFVPVFCLLGFSIHTLITILLDLNTRKTTTEFSEKSFSSMELPFLFEISVTPAFKPDKMREYGYGQPFYFFQGTNNHNQFLGWSKDDSNKLSKSTKEIFEDITTIQNLNEVIEKIVIFSHSGDYTSNISVDVASQPMMMNNHFILDPSELVSTGGDLTYLSFLPRYKPNMTLHFSLIDKVVKLFLN